MAVNQHMLPNHPHSHYPLRLILMMLKIPQQNNPPSRIILHVSFGYISPSVVREHQQLAPRSATLITLSECRCARIWQTRQALNMLSKILLYKWQCCRVNTNCVGHIFLEHGIERDH